MIIATAAAAAAAILALISARWQERVRRKRKVFLIYSGKDVEKARELAALLRKVGLEPWLDDEQVAAGQVWKTAIRRGLDESTLAIALISGNFQSNTFANFELEEAIKVLHSPSDEFAPVIPVRLDDAPLPSLLADVRSIDMRSPSATGDLLKGLARAGLAVKMSG